MHRHVGTGRGDRLGGALLRAQAAVAVAAVHGPRRRGVRRLPRRSRSWSRCSQKPSDIALKVELNRCRLLDQHGLQDCGTRRDAHPGCAVRGILVIAQAAMRSVQPVDIIENGAVLGEGILWDARRQCLWWTDIHARRIHRYDWAARALATFETPDRVASLGLVAGQRCVDRRVRTAASRSTTPDTGAVEWLARPEEDLTGLRFNDGRVDRAGRFWSGTMVEGEAQRQDGEPVLVRPRRGPALPGARRAHLERHLHEPGRHAALLRRFADAHHLGLRPRSSPTAPCAIPACSRARRRAPTPTARRSMRTAACGARTGARAVPCAIRRRASSTGRSRCRPPT